MNKTSNKRRLFIGSALAGLLAVGTSAFAGPHCKHGGKHGGMKGKYSEKHAEKRAEYMQKKFERMSAKLGLTDEQKQGMQALMENHKNAMKPLRDEKRAIRQEMKQLNPTDSDYSAKLADIANRKSELVRQMTISRGNQRQQMAQLLTPEQLAKKQEMRAKHGKRKGKLHHGH